MISTQEARVAGRRRWLGVRICLVGGALAFSSATALPQDPLPSWNEGSSKQRILRFVSEATREGGPSFVPPAQRIAVFDNDGTLWTEQPAYVQDVFMKDRLRALAVQRPELKRDPAVRKALAAPDNHDARSEPASELTEILAAAHAGLTPDQYEQTVLNWLATARHPRFGRPYTELVYQPMLEVIQLLQDHGFKVYIVSGGGQDFMRPWTEQVYGIPREQVVGSNVVLKYQVVHDTVPLLLRLPKINFIDDKEGKPIGIERFIGRRPVAAFGNSDGDQQMLQYTAGGRGASLMVLIHHDDCSREYCYNRQSRVGRLDKALDEARTRGWTVVSMKDDWRYIYPFQIPRRSGRR